MAKAALPPRANNRTRTRKFWLNIHLYLGLIVGLVFVLEGLTGSILAFYVDIDELLNPEISLTQTDKKWQSYETLFQALTTAHPERKGAWRLQIPAVPDRMITARYYKPKETAHISFAPLMVWVTPYTAEVVSSRFWGNFAMTWIFDLHYRLLLDSTGAIILSILGLLITVSLCTGIYLWWPSKGKIKKAFSLKKRASSERFNFDLHKLNGIYGLSILLLLVVTGVLLAFPPIKPAVASLSTLYHPHNTQSNWSANSHRLPIDHIVKVAQAQFPFAAIKWIETPKSITGSFRINLRQPGEPSIRFPKTNVWVDQYNGEILAIRDVKKDSAGDTFLRWLHPLHSGEVLGLTGRIIVCIAGFIPLILYITGVRRWLQKRRVQNNNSNRN